MPSNAYPLHTHRHDVLIIGAGGAGLRAAIAAAEAGANVAVLTKVPPTRSHTVAAQGGINAALGNVSPDDWRWHMYDTIRGSDWLGDQDAIAFMCQKAPEAIRDLDKMGVEFTRDEKGNIYQRAYGGMSTHFGKGSMAYRACAAADHTGDAMMRGLYNYVQQYKVDFFVEYLALDLLFDKDNHCIGALAWELATGQMHLFLAREIILATGGYSQVYAAATSSSTCTGDGNAMVLRAGLPLKDMEYVQFHPTGLYKVGILISEAARAEGGYLLNGKGERFMDRYAPKFRELASRDVVTRAIIREITEGRGAGENKDHVLLDISHLPPAVIEEKLPTTQSLAAFFASVDVTKSAIPVYPTAHYTMGGIPANRECEVLNHQEQTVPGLYAIGEAACNSVHGANRLGCNSLLDLVVFGKYAGINAAKAASKNTVPGKEDIAPESLERALSYFDAMRFSKGEASPTELRGQVQNIMQENAGIIREGQSLSRGLAACESLLHNFTDVAGIREQSLQWNTELVGAIETHNLLVQALATLAAANFRTESRGAHYRSDCPVRDDDHWLVHTLVSLDETGTSACSTRPVRFDTATMEAESILPEARTY